MLSQSDVDRLLTEPTAPVRAAVADKLAEELDSPRLTDTERAMVQDVIRIMAKDVEVTVRQALAEGLRHAKRLPHDVAVRLANDVDAVALPILIDSTLLTDADLIQIVRRGTPAKQEAIGGRNGVSEQVAHALITDATETAVGILMRNEHARIGERSLGHAVDRFHDSDVVKQSIVQRSTLPVAITERLVSMVSDQLRDYLVSHHDMSPALAANMVLKSREQATTQLSFGSTGLELEELVAQIHDNGRMTPSLLLRMLCIGDLAFFETALARLAKIPVENARVLVHDAGGNGLVSLYAAARLPPRLLPAVQAALTAMHDLKYDGGEHDLERYRTGVVTRLLTQFEDFDQEDLDYLLAKIGGPFNHAA